jgi:hypothetical protein
MKAHSRVDMWSCVFFTTALVGGVWSATLLGHFNSGERPPGTHFIGGQVGTRASLDNREK